MRAEERQHRILTRARADGWVEVRDAAADLAVAAETVRRDLRVLEQHGLIRRTHGGAYPVESAGFETNLANRATTRVAEKRRIAVSAIEFLHDAETVFIDEGFTPQLVAEQLPPGRTLTVITSSLPIAMLLAPRQEITVLMLGGRVRGRTLATVDHWTTQMLSTFVIDLAVLGANGISRSRGLTTPDPAVANVKAHVVRASRRRVFVGVHAKFGATSFCRFAAVQDMEAIVTDSGLPAAEAQKYTLLGPQVVRA